jgi:branched-chain amino acid transport system ATP-binding protein
MADLLHVENLRAGYGEAVIVDGVSFSLPAGQTLALLGRNGTGKTTLINTLAGATRQHGGTITAVARPGRWTPKEVYGMFPRLQERRGNLGTQLSGGEQQMLAMGRALVLNPKLLLLDEPLEGLAPIIVEELLKAIARITRGEGLSAIIVEQHPQAILAISHEAIVLDHGTVVHAGSAAQLAGSPGLLDRLLGVAR